MLISQIIHCIMVVSIIASVMLSSAPVRAQSLTTAQMIASAPSILVLLDNSSSSPATDEGLIANAWPLIEQKLRSMPMASVVMVTTVGTAEFAPKSLRLRIQTRSSPEGGHIEDVVKLVREVVLGLPNKIKDGTIPTHETSNLIAGLFDASKAINVASDKNVIILISDLVENSKSANCYRTMPCKLPKPQFSLPGTELIALGVGWGMSSEREISLVQVWEQYFAKLHLVKPAVIKTKLFG